MLKTSLIGAGYWGKNILRNLYELGVLNVVCDSCPEVANECRKKYPKVRCVSSLEEAIYNPEISAVIIATPAITHFDLAKKALLADKDVFVEKPLALNLEEGEELFDLAKSRKRILMVGHILQYHPAVVKLKQMISSGILGKIRYIYSNRLNIGKLRIEENILWSFAPHDISVILMLLGEEPLQVFSFGGDYLSKGINDVTMTCLEFSNGVKGHIFVSWLHPFKEQKLVVVGSKAMVVFDDLSKQKLLLYPHKIEWKDGKIPVARRAGFRSISVTREEPLRVELEHFLKCVRLRANPKTDGEEALRVLRVLKAAERCRPDNSVISGNLGRKIFIHNTSIIDDDVEIGPGTQIWHFSHIIRGSKIGKNCHIGQNVVIGPDVRIGNGCKIQNNISIYKGVTLEDLVFCGPACVFTNVLNPRSEIPRMRELRPTLIGKGATIGANATIICGNDLGRYCFVGSGSVVTKPVPAYALVYGNPARTKGWMCECGVKLYFNGAKAICKACRKKYILKNKVVNRQFLEI